MSAALLAKLKVKNAPQKKESVQVIVQVPGKKEEVKIKTQIVDKTDEEFNRELFIKEIQKFSSKTEKQTNITEPSTKPVEQNKPKKKGKKLSKRRDLHPRNILSIPKRGEAGIPIAGLPFFYLLITV